MSRRHEQFTVGDHPRVELSTFSGDIVVAEGDAGVIEVTLNGSPDRFIIEQRGDTVVAEPESGRRIGGSTDITVKVPAGTSARLKCTSGDILVEVPISKLEAGVASGDVRAVHVTGDASVKTASGDTRIENVGGSLNIATASGRAGIGPIGGDLHMTAASGEAVIESIYGTARIRTASGDIRIRKFDGTDLIAKTISGDVTIGVPSRRRIDVDLQSLSGSLRNRLKKGDGSPPEKTITLRVKSVSGDLTLRGA
jgi:DUF4097 and DUF4098 domain-containing protein YvlB